MLIAYLKEDTIFDSQGIDEMLELAKTFARRELERRRFTDQRTPSITVDVEMDCRDIAS
jgi:hypothetical protein